MKYGHVATVFGGSGFVGHAVIQALAGLGYTVRVPTRDRAKAETLRTLGDVGQIVPFHASTRTDQTVHEALKGSEIVINLIGAICETNKASFQLVHVETAARLARVARQAGVKQFVHISALGADMHAKSSYTRTKGLGEEAVRAFFPDAVLLRPSLIFGPKDAFFNKLGFLARFCPLLPLIGDGKAKFQPVYVGDVAKAVVACLNGPKARGHVFALGGPHIYSFRELFELVTRLMGVERPFVTIPLRLTLWTAKIAERLPLSLITRDQVNLLQKDNILRPKAGYGSLVDLGIKPTSLEEVLPDYLVRPAKKVKGDK